MSAKREPDDSLLPPPAKRPLHQLSESGPLTQQDVVYFKKEAIWRQMTFYKQQVSELRAELARHEQEHAAFVAAHLLLESWYAQVLGLQDASGNSPEKLDLSASTDTLESVLASRAAKLAELLLPLAKANTETAQSVLDAVQLRADKETAEAKLQELANKLAEVQAEYERLVREKDRAESLTLKRVAANSHAPESEPEPEAQQQAAAAVASTAESEAAAKALEELQIQYAEVDAARLSLQEQLQETTGRLNEAETKLAALQDRLNNLDDADLARSTKFLALVDKNKIMSEALNLLTAVKDGLVAKVKEFESREGNFIALVSKELQDENTHLKELLSKAESDLVRIRTARDHLLAQQTIMKLETENRKTNDELLKLNNVLHERLSQLENARAQQLEPSETLNALEKPDLVKRLQLLTSELQDIEKAFQDSRNIALEKNKETVDREGLLKKLTIEKTKADQKYFASMRLKDLLVTENKVLKSQVQKLQELLANLGDLDKTYAGKIDVLTKSVNDFRVIRENAIQETAKLQETLKHLTKSREGAAKEITSLKDELARSKKEHSDMASELSTLKTRGSKLEAKLRATESLLTKYKQSNTSLILQEDEKQMEALRAITKCSVCLKNWKNTVITACGHVFCDGCVQKRLSARLRRCPTCNKGFSVNDLLSIHL